MRYEEGNRINLLHSEIQATEHNPCRDIARTRPASLLDRQFPEISFFDRQKSLREIFNFDLFE